MTELIKNFFIKDGYSCNLEAKTFDIDLSDQYWTEERVEKADISYYQYDVYLLASKIALEKRLKVGMDLGCGPATKAKQILSIVLDKIVLVDQPSCEKIAKKLLPDAKFIGINLENCDQLLDLDQKNEMMDLIICADVLEHLFNPYVCLKLIHKYLKPSGIVIFSTPNRDVLRGQKCMRSPHPSHVREWNKPELRDLLEYSRFNILEHLDFPPKRLSRIEQFVRFFLHYIVPLPRWNSCQVAVCSKKF